MGRPMRFLPPECPLVEVTCRTLQGRLLLSPSRQLNSLVRGVLARAARLNAMRVCAFVFLSNHYLLLLRPRDASQLAAFMNYLNGNLVKEAGRLHRWREKFWGRRYRAIPVSFEPEAQIARLKYLLEQGTKDNLVARPQDWPGAHLSRCHPSADKPRTESANRKVSSPESVFKDMEVVPAEAVPGFEPPRIHVERDRKLAKFWLEPVFEVPASLPTN